MHQTLAAFLDVHDIPDGNICTSAFVPLVLQVSATSVHSLPAVLDSSATVDASEMVALVMGVRLRRRKQRSATCGAWLLLFMIFESSTIRFRRSGFQW